MNASTSPLAFAVLGVLLALDGLLLLAHGLVGPFFLLDLDVGPGGNLAAAFEVALGVGVALAAFGLALVVSRGMRAASWACVGLAFAGRALDVATGLSHSIGGNLAHIRFFWRLADWQPEDPARLAFFSAMLPLLVLVYGALARFFALRLEGRARVAAVAGIVCLALASVLGALGGGLLVERALDLLGPTLVAFALVGVLESPACQEARVAPRAAARRIRIGGGAAVAVLALALVATATWVRAPSDRGLDPARWRVQASEAGAAAHLSVDGDPETGWSTEHSQRPEQWLEVDLGRVHEIRELVLYTGTDLMDAPRRLELWAGVGAVPLAPLPFDAIASDPPSSRQRLRFDPPLVAQVLRLVQQGEHGLYRWSVRELYLYGQAL